MSRLTRTRLSVAGTDGGSEAPPADAQASAPVNTFPTASTRAPLHNRVLIRLLRSRLHRLVDSSVVALRVRGVVTGSLHEFPVIYAVDSTGYVVYPGRPDTKRWWRNLRRPAQVSLLHGGCWQGAIGVLLRPGAPGYEGALHAYHRRWPKVIIRPTDALVHIQLPQMSRK